MTDTTTAPTHQIGVWVATERYHVEGIQQILGVYSSREGAVAAVEAAHQVDTADPSHRPEDRQLRWDGDSGGNQRGTWYTVETFRVQP